MKEISVNVANNYKVYIENGLLDKVAEMTLSLVSPKTVAIITDDNVQPKYLDRVSKGFIERGVNVISFVFQNGEQSKNLHTYQLALEFLAQNSFKRTDLIVALGGGVVGDLAGFVAATFARGVKFVQVPTTLLSAIDSSVGGKTAVDLPQGKNLVGAFHQPIAVFLDTSTLKSLPPKEWVNGYGELVKYGILAGGNLWKMLKSDYLDLEEAIALCVAYKAKIVEEDEKDLGVRALLNLGHTLAHSVENLSSYTIPHGVAVGYGTRRITEACAKSGLLNHDVKTQILKVLDKFGLNYIAPFDTLSLVKESTRDKKAFSDFIDLIVINDIGNCSIKKFKLSELEEFFNND